MAETSLSKGHPIETLEQVRARYRALGLAIRVRFRGPRRGYSYHDTLKKNAHSFSVYMR